MRGSVTYRFEERERDSEIIRLLQYIIHMGTLHSLQRLGRVATCE